jgi:predicted nucleic acid-binding protein
VRFWDASALISLCVNDPNAAAMRKLAEEDESIVAWWGTVVECHSAFFRLGRQGELEDSDVDRARRLLDQLIEGWSEIVPSPEVREQAVRLLGLHPVRAADSLQLAAAPRGWIDVPLAAILSALTAACVRRRGGKGLQHFRRRKAK